MGRPRKIHAVNNADGAAAGVGHNGIAETAKPFLAEIEELIARMESRKGEYMAVCKSLRKDISDVYGRAKDAGVPYKPLKTLVKTNGLHKRIKKTIETLDIDESATYHHLAEALGELGLAAARRAGYADGSTASTGNGAASVEVHAEPAAPAGPDEDALAKFGEHLGRA